MQTRTIVPLLLIVAACQQGPSNDADPQTVENVGNVNLVSADGGQLGPQIEVWSDPKATYTDEGSGVMPNGHLWLTTRRDGPSGVSFAKREIDCAEGTFRYLQEGDTLESMSDDAPSGMAPLTEGSISTLVSDYACRKHHQGGVSGI